MDPIPDLSAIDLRMLPDWLRESSGPTAHPAFPDEDSRHGGREDGRRRDDPSPRKGFDRRDAGGARRGGMQGPKDRRDDRRGGPARPGRDSRAPQTPEPPRPAPVAPAEVEVSILPDPQVVEKLAAHIRQTRAAHPLIALAHLFLAAPERYRLRIRTRGPESLIHTVGGDGPAAMDPALLPRPAFIALRDRFYREEEISIDPPKGAFTSVARCPLSNTLLGPTSFHTFQPTLRALYERRFRNRMSFERYRAQLEIVSHPETVEAWKQQVSRKVVFHRIPPSSPPVETPEGTPAETPIESALPLGSEEEAFADFRDHLLPGLLRSGTQITVPGAAMVRCPDRSLSAAIRAAIEEQTRFPGRLAHALQSALGHHGVHLWKHRKRHLFVSVIRPSSYSGDLSLLSERMRAILAHVTAHPRCSRKAVANALIGPAAPLPENAAPAPATEDPPATDAVPASDPARDAALRELANATHFLIDAGHVILFHNGSLDLPWVPRPDPSGPAKTSKGSAIPKAPPEPLPGPPPQPDSRAIEISSESAEPTPSAATPAATPAGPARFVAPPTLQPEQ